MAVTVAPSPDASARAGYASAPADSLLPLLAAAAARLDPALVGPAASARVAATLARLPAALSDLAYLEVRLDARPTVDLVLHVAAAARPLLVAGPPWPGLADWSPDAPAWARVAALARAWRGDDPALAALVHHLWLEFDLDGAEHPAPPALPPGVFACFGELRPAEHAPARWAHAARRALATLVGANAGGPAAVDGPDGVVSAAGATPMALPAALAAPLDACLAALPAAAYLPYVGAMLGRGRESARLCVVGLDAPALAAYLRAVGWARDARLDATLGALVAAQPAGPLHGVGMLHLDVARDGPWRAGFEFGFQRAPQRAGRLAEEALLAALIAAGLARADKVRALARWPGGAAVRTAGAAPCVVARRVNHVKLVARPGHPLEAKVYLAAQRLAPPAPSAPRTLAPAMEVTPCS